MKRFLLWIIIVQVVAIAQAQEITYLEYFIDIDPGYGQGTNVAFSANETIDLSFIANLQSVENGLHTIFVRTKDNLDNWSIVQAKSFVRLAGIGASIPQILRAEYFIDTDPGFGQGIAINFLPLPELELDFEVDLSNIETGLHQLFVRIQDHTGAWSTVHYENFIRLTGAGQETSEIIYAEYFIDTDPGFGNANSLAITNGKTVNLTTDIDLQAIATGLHRFSLRVQDNQGAWSTLLSDIFIRLEGIGGVTEITELEYFIDTDPGLGNGIKIPFTAATLENLTISLDVSSLADDLHYYCVRAKDNAGKWAILQCKEFCTPISPISKFDHIQVGNMVSFINESINADSYLWDFGDGTTSNLSNPIKEYPIGNYTICMKAISDCMEHESSIELNLKGVEDYRPKSGGNGGKIFMDIYGIGFDDQTKVYLTKSGETDILPLEFQFINSSHLTVLFNLNQATLGNWELVVEYNGVSSFQVTNDFLIEPATNIRPTLRIIAPTFGRTNVFQPVNLIVENPNNNDLEGVPMFIYLPEGTTLNFDFSIFVPVDEVIDYGDYIGPISIDTIFGVNTTGFELYSFIIPFIPAKGTTSYPVEVLMGTSGNELPINGFLGNPMYSGLNDAVNGGGNGGGDGGNSCPFIPDFQNCLAEAIKDAVFDRIGVGPLSVACACSIMDLRQNDFYKNLDDEDFVRNNAGNLQNGLLSYLAKVMKAVSDCGTISAPATSAIDIGDLELALDIGSNIVKGLIKGEDSHFYCDKAFPPVEPETHTIQRIFAADPNDKLGYEGVLTEKYVNNQNFYYTIRFENLEDATAPAQTVTILDTLDKNIFDFKTFELGNVKIGNATINVPSSRTSYSVDANLGFEGDILVRLNAKLDTVSGVICWQFLTLNAATKELVSNPAAGFLPPNVNSPEGEGSVSFSISLKETIESGTQIFNQASIIFDANDAILTNTWMNTLDQIAPISEINAAIPDNRINSNKTIATLIWTGQDTDSGINNYRVYGKKNGGLTLLYLYNVDTTMGQVEIELDSVYEFYAVAIDNVGNEEAIPLVADIILQLDSSDIVTCPSTLVVSGLASDSLYQADELLESDAEIIGSDLVKFQAETIILTEGFHAPLGTNFKAQSLNCENTYHQEIPSESRKLLNSEIKAPSVNLSIYPNPFSSELNIAYELAKPNIIHLNIFNQIGELVSSPLSNIPHKEGKYMMSLSSNGLSNGLYWLQLLTEDEKIIKKVMLIK